MPRITISHLMNQITKLNKLILDNPDPGRIKNAFHLSSAYGGYSLHQYTSDTYSTRDVLNTGHVPKKRLYKLIQAFKTGLEYKN